MDGSEPPKISAKRLAPKRPSSAAAASAADNDDITLYSLLVTLLAHSAPTTAHPQHTRNPIYTKKKESQWVEAKRSRKPLRLRLSGSVLSCHVLSCPDRALHSYPKHVWSPAGGWYAQPSNWKSNTAVASLVVTAITAAVWMTSARLEDRPHMPEPHRFFPSR